MGRTTYARTKCFICGKNIAVAGLARVGHMRMHVRKGEATEKKETPYGGYRFERVWRNPNERK